jgi:guanylate kinase
MIESGNRSLLLIISGPSGTGKTTLCDRLVKDFDRISYSVSCTTRSPRANEIDGQSYHFLDEESFRSHLSQNAFLEHAIVHGNFYGTMRTTVYNALEAGRDILMDIDVQGADQIRQYARNADPGDAVRGGWVDVFVAPPTMEALSRRLRDRGMDNADAIELRMKQAENEMARAGEYGYLVVNDGIEEAYNILKSIVVAEHHRRRVSDSG